MGRFKYQAKESSGNTVEGVIEANSTEEAIEKINNLGRLPVKVEQEEKKAPKASVTPRDAAVSRKGKKTSGKIKSREISTFGRQLASLIRAGTPILRAIAIVQETSENPHFRNFLSQIHAEVKNGKSFSASLSEYPSLFPPLYIALVSAGELSGTLDQTLITITEHRQKQEEIVSRVRSAMVYPALMAFTGIGTIIFMLTFVMPRLMGIFDRLGGELPLPTQILISVSTALREYWYVGIIVVVGILFAARTGKKNPANKLFLSRLQLQLPVFGPLSLKAEIAQLSRTMELVLRSGIPILKALESATMVVSNEIIRKELARCQVEVREGGSFGKSMRKAKVFPASMTHLVTIGEESGRLDEALGEIATYYERETDEAIRTMTSLLEPVMILVMGLIVGFIVIAMLLPMFELNMMVG